MSKSDIIPAILATSVSDLESKLAELPKEVKLVHIDTLEEDIWTSACDIDFEVHLMVSRPEEIMERWVERGAKRIIVHTISDGITRFRGKVEIGLAVELDIAIENILSIIPEVDFVHLMSIAEIGAQGRPLDVQIFDRIRKVKEKFPQTALSVDGGIKITNYQALENSGVDRLVVGSGFKELWKSLTRK
jgi:pentose-5-phosphate-3-epimerase